MNQLTYIHNADNSARFVLGTSGSNPIIVIGVNPSTATDIQDDQTVRRVKAISIMQNFNGWYLMNLSSIRSTLPAELPTTQDNALHLENLQNIKSFMQEVHKSYNDLTIWCAWGDSIDSRNYLKSNLQDIVGILAEYEPTYVVAASLTNAGNPRHPLFLLGSSPFTEFDINSYIE